MLNPDLVDRYLPPITNLPGNRSDLPRMQALVEAAGGGLLAERVLGLPHDPDVEQGKTWSESRR